MMVYNEFDPFAAEWLENLMAAGEIPAGAVDQRSIKELTGKDCGETLHLFAGIGGWPLALKLAGWPDNLPVWTGSCPCQPFSAAGKRGGTADDRHLWPEMFRLILERRPAIVFGEQVASGDGLAWLDGVFADLEGAGYTCGAADLCAAGVGAPHGRQRLYWMAHTIASGLRRKGHEGEQAAGIDRRIGVGGLADTGCGEARRGGDRRRASSNRDEADDGKRQSELERHGETGRLEHPQSDGRNERRSESSGRSPAARCGFGGLAGPVGDPTSGGAGLDERWLRGMQHTPNAWDDYGRVLCQDGKTRRIGCGVQPLAYGIPRGMGSGVPELASLYRGARGNRSGRLKGYGNAIVPEVAAVFIRVAMEWLGIEGKQ